MAIGKKVILQAVPYRREFGTEKWIQDEEHAMFVQIGAINISGEL